MALPGGALGAGRVQRDGRLSNERIFTRWAHIARAGPIRARPSARFRRVSRLHRYTEDGCAEVYLLLEAHTSPDGHRWVKLRIPGRPNGREGWVPRPELGGITSPTGW